MTSRTRSSAALLLRPRRLLPAVALAPPRARGGLINLDRSLVIQGINFLLLLFILGKLLYKPLLAKMEERTQAIGSRSRKRRPRAAEAQREREEHAAKLQAAYAEAQAIRATALKEAAEEQRRLVEGARAEAARLVESRGPRWRRTSAARARSCARR